MRSGSRVARARYASRTRPKKTSPSASIRSGASARAAGWSRVPYRLFAAVNMPVSAVWGATYATLGYLVTDEVTGRVGPGVVYFGLAVAATVALAGLVHRRVRRWRKPPEGPPDQPRASDPRPADRQLVAAADR